MPKKAKAAPDAATAHVEELTFPEGSRDGFDSASDEEYDEQSEPESLGLNSEEGDDETADDSDGEDGGPFSDASASGSDMERDILDIARAGEEDGQAFGGQRSDGVDVWMRGHATTLCISIHSVDPGSDSSDDELPNVNTVGNIPLQWYKDEDHIGYDREGTKILRKQRGDKLDELLARNDSSKGWRTIYDEYNDREITLSKEEVRLIQRIRQAKFPDANMDPYEPELDYFSREQEIHPLSNAPEPKRRFIPSKWEEKKIVRLVRALRKGWIKADDLQQQQPGDALLGEGHDETPPLYLMWADDGQVSERVANGLTYLAPPRMQLPGHEESYNPPPEYLPTDEELAAQENLPEEDKPAFTPKSYPNLRTVPAYDKFIRERFERCLDLYLCPRTRQRRLEVPSSKALLPKLPKPSELKPYPSLLVVSYEGHTGAIHTLAPSPCGQWLGTGAADGCVKVWEVATGRCMTTIPLSTTHQVHTLAWNPDPTRPLLAAASHTTLSIFHPHVGTTEGSQAASQLLQDAAVAASQLTSATTTTTTPSAAPLATWEWSAETQRLTLEHRFPVTFVCWHGRGEYFATVAPTGNTQAVLVHQLSRGATQCPFRKNKGRVSRVLFHPSKPFFFVATQNHVRVYNLAKQALAKKLQAGSGTIASMAVHPTGDHLLVGCEDKRLLWFDLDLSSKPYKTLRYHDKPLRAVAFHSKYPLFASGADDAQVQVFHGTVYNDLMSNPLIVPLKTLHGHMVQQHMGVRATAFHPTQPWLFTGGGDHKAALYCNV